MNNTEDIKALRKNITALKAEFQAMRTIFAAIFVQLPPEIRTMVLKNVVTFSVMKEAAAEQSANSKPLEQAVHQVAQATDRLYQELQAVDQMKRQQE